MTTTLVDLTKISIDELSQIDNLSELKEWTKGCKACSLRQESVNVTHSSGPFDSPIMFTGMNPGFCEDGTGIPFCGRDELAESQCVSCKHYKNCYNWQTGLGASRPMVANCYGYSPNPPGTPNAIPPQTVNAGPYTLKGLISAGQLLDEALKALGINRKEIFITNSALCKTNTGEPKAQHLNSCSRIRQRTQQLLKPKVIVALGRLAISQYSGRQVTLSKQHGIPFKYVDANIETICVPTYHPSAILRKMLASSHITPIEQKASLESITSEKWSLYSDLGTAFNLLQEADLERFLLPGKKLVNGKLDVQVRK